VSIDTAYSNFLDREVQSWAWTRGSRAPSRSIRNWLYRVIAETDDKLMRRPSARIRQDHHRLLKADRLVKKRRRAMADEVEPIERQSMRLHRPPSRSS